MSSFLLVIDLKNSAFEDDAELSRILHKLSLSVEGLSVDALVKLASGTVRDTNGNTVGLFNIDPNDP